ncbi:MAG TPA: hypothetical protein VGM88_03160 [Kofleriaceae bacterium]|jgi:hypothetical protein
MKVFAAVPVVLFMLVGPALADSVAPDPVPFDVTIHVAGADQTFHLGAASGSCAHAERDNATRTDHVSVCMHDERVDVDWETRLGPQHYKASSTALIARGGSFEAGSADAHVTVKRL